jgi:hypothetical protein
VGLVFTLSPSEGHAEVFAAEGGVCVFQSWVNNCPFLLAVSRMRSFHNRKPFPFSVSVSRGTFQPRRGSDMRNGTCITRREGAARLRHRAASLHHREFCHPPSAILPGTRVRVEMAVSRRKQTTATRSTRYTPRPAAGRRPEQPWGRERSLSGTIRREKMPGPAKRDRPLQKQLRIPHPQPGAVEESPAIFSFLSSRSQRDSNPYTFGNRNHRKSQTTNNGDPF